MSTKVKRKGSGQQRKKNVDAETRQEWKLNIDHADLTAIANESGIPRQRISATYNDGKGREDAIKAITAFVRRKKRSAA